MTNTRRYLKTQRPALQRAFPFRLRETQAALFKSSCKSANRNSNCFPRHTRWVSLRNGPADEQGRFPASSLLSSALASKDQGGSPDHASRLFALGSIREVGQMLCPSRDRGRGHP